MHMYNTGISVPWFERYYHDAGIKPLFIICLVLSSLWFNICSVYLRKCHKYLLSNLTSSLSRFEKMVCCDYHSTSFNPNWQIFKKLLYMIGFCCNLFQEPRVSQHRRWSADHIYMIRIIRVLNTIWSWKCICSKAAGGNSFSEQSKHNCFTGWCSSHCYAKQICLTGG